MALVWWEHWS